jgi:hypothetical protein
MAPSDRRDGRNDASESVARRVRLATQVARGPPENALGRRLEHGISGFAGRGPGTWRERSGIPAKTEFGSVNSWYYWLDRARRPAERAF